MYYFLGIAIIIMAFFLYNYYHFQPKQLLLFKVITSFCFIILGLIAIISKEELSKYTLFMMLGLFSGFVGDIVLGYRKISTKSKNLFIALGIVFFACGHSFYIFAISHFIKNYLVYLIVGCSLIVISFIFIKMARLDCGKVRALMYIYTIITSILISISFLNMIYDPVWFKISTALGILFFASSDYILAFLYFRNSKNHHKVWKRLNLGLYYGGQFLLALSIYLH